LKEGLTMEEIIISGKVVRIARLVKNITLKELSDMTGINDNYLSKIERGEKGATVSVRNYFRLLRALREVGYTDQQIVAITILAENIDELEEKTV
jgi:transcriptional regulator with XRE-family HTH domain